MGWARLVAAALLVAPLAGCSDDEPVVEVVYASELAVPDRGDYPGGTDETPDAADAIVRAELGDGGRVVVWIDPDDKRQVTAQFSDPDDPSRWTEPTMVVRAGDGCLYLELDTDGGTAALGASCYEFDTFAQQAPDQSFVAVSTDRVTWQFQELQREADPEPSVEDDGDRVVWTNGALGDYEVAEWTRDDGF